MAGRRRLIASITVALGLTSIGAVGVTLAANAQGSEVVSKSASPSAGYQFLPQNPWIGQPMTMIQTGIDGGGVPVEDVIQEIYWGDGSIQMFPGTTTRFTHVYRTARNYTVSVIIWNGESVPRRVRHSLISVRKDVTKPSATLTKPSSPTRATSWATVKGKASDTGMGVRNIALTAIEKRGKTWFYYNGSSWVKASSAAVAGKKAKVLTAVPAAGKWSVKIKGLKKGSVRFAYSAFDRAGNRSTAKYLTQTLSR